MNNEKNILPLVFLFISVSFIIFVVARYDEKQEEEIFEACSAVNYELVTIKGSHYCLPFMPEQESG